MHSFLVPMRPNQYYSRFHILDKIFFFLHGQKIAENLFRVADGIRRLPALKYIPDTVIKHMSTLRVKLTKINKTFQLILLNKK